MIMCIKIAPFSSFPISIRSEDEENQLDDEDEAPPPSDFSTTIIGANPSSSFRHLEHCRMLRVDYAGHSDWQCMPRQ